MDHIALGKRLRDARERRSLSQQAAADELGLPRTAVTLIEGGRGEFPPASLRSLQASTEPSVGELLSPGEPQDDPLVVLYRQAPQMRNDPGVKLAVERCL